MAPAPPQGFPRGNKPYENPGLTLYNTQARARLSQGNGSHVGVTHTKLYLHIYMHVKGKKTEGEKGKFGKLWEGFTSQETT